LELDVYGTVMDTCWITSMKPKNEQGFLRAMHDSHNVCIFAINLNVISMNGSFHLSYYMLKPRFKT